jgi:uridine kinase
MALINKELRNITDLKVYIHVSEPIRLERIVSRDEKERGRNRQMVEERFFQTVQPMHNRYIEPYKRFADVVLDGDHHTISEMTDEVEHLISTWIQKYAYKSGNNF